MALRLQICFLVLVVRGMAEALGTERLTVMEGQTLIFRCSIHEANVTHVELKNPHGFVIFFNSHKALRDKRYRLVTLSHSEYTISLANVTFKDGGHYMFSQYAQLARTKQFKVTVLGLPKLETTEHEGRTAIKCTAEANCPPPRISWLFESGLELDAPHPQYQCDGKTGKCSSEDILLVQSHKRRVTVKCLVHHRALYNSTLMNFVSIGKDLSEEQFSSATVGYWSSTAETAEEATQSTVDPRSGDDSNTTVAVTTVSALANTSTNSSLGGNTTVAVTTVSALTNTSTNSSLGESPNEWDENENETQSAPLLIFLVTGLILGLLVVVIFFLIKLRRAHVVWKTENENSEQSLESSKSKSSHEEKQERKLQISVINPGYQNNTNFTRYIAEEPSADAAINGENEEAAQIQRDNQNPCAVTTIPQIKETEL